MRYHNLVYITVWLEIWNLTSSLFKKIAAFEMWIYRKMMRVSWTERVTNNSVLERANAERKLVSTIQTRKLKYFGHTIRQNNIQRVLLEG